MFLNRAPLSLARSVSRSQPVLTASTKRSYHIFKDLADWKKYTRVRKRLYPFLGLLIIIGSPIMFQLDEEHIAYIRPVTYPPLAGERNFKIPLPWECYRCGFFEVNCHVKCYEELAQKKVAYQVLNEPYVKQQYA